MYKFDISIIVPLYNEEESLPELAEWIHRVTAANNLTTEIIMVDDGSTDHSWEIVQRLAKQYREVRGLRFRRNYGKSAALHCGFQEAEGEVVITMDADLQDSPDEIPALVAMIRNEEYDLVSGWKKVRHDPIGKTIPSKVWNYFARVVTDIKLHDFNCGLKAYKNEVVKNIEIYGEMHRYIPVIARRAGFDKIGEKQVTHRERKYGVTKFGIERLLKGFLDLLSVMFMSKFGNRPMHLFGGIGTLMFFIGLVSALYLGIKKLWFVAHAISASLVTDSPYFYISLTCMILGTQLFLAGFVAELIGRSSSNRNNYQVRENVEQQN
ncbi:MAG: glycosyltransferase family 2 protein [Cytophagaceae bacterium]|jgi:glycosyltransferase involved in cell wall biosynthesis|nr:glycosyltransferase family 2 protein [Cytophagaceae bacterium]